MTYEPTQEKQTEYYWAKLYPQMDSKWVLLTSCGNHSDMHNHCRLLINMVDITVVKEMKKLYSLVFKNTIRIL